MSRRPTHAPSCIIMVRPHRFAPNPATRIDNAFQAIPTDSPDEVSRSAYLEVTAMADAIERAGVRVHLFEDHGRSAPDSVFPNNWFTTHPDGTVAVYPMFSPSRRSERRSDVIELLKSDYYVTTVYDYSGLEHDELYLEGTGVMVFDHVARLAYVCRSHRVSEPALQRFCTDHGYDSLVFDAVDTEGVPVYHTNVMMSVGTDLALVGLSSITDLGQRRRVVEHLEATGRTVIDLTAEQVADFAGNAIELAGADGLVLVMSARGVRSLRPDQVRAIEASTALLPVDIPTIEYAGGSARCMIAGVHLRPRAVAAGATAGAAGLLTVA